MCPVLLSAQEKNTICIQVPVYTRTAHVGALNYVLLYCIHMSSMAVVVTGSRVYMLVLVRMIPGTWHVTMGALVLQGF